MRKRLDTTATIALILLTLPAGIYVCRGRTIPLPYPPPPPKIAQRLHNRLSLIQTRSIATLRLRRRAMRSDVLIRLRNV